MIVLQICYNFSVPQSLLHPLIPKEETGPHITFNILLPLACEMLVLTAGPTYTLEL